MSQTKFINVMISSRNSASFDGMSLNDIRTKLKERIESEEVFGDKIFKVWINEYENPQSFDERIWSKCLKEAVEADIVLVLNNGEAGWTKKGDSIGICHAEAIAAVETARGKVWALNLNVPAGKKKSDNLFQKYMQEQELFTTPISSYQDLLERTDEAMQDAVLKLMQRGVFDASRSKNNMGTALQWKRMNYRRRSEAIVEALQDAIKVDGSGEVQQGKYYLHVNGIRILFIIHGIPDTMSISAAKEYVGQPFLNDYELEKVLQESDVVGPVHIIGAHKSVTETQARNTLGFPDATILKDAFGTYVADNIQKIQMVYISKCSDPSSTKHGFQQFRNWLFDSREADELLTRATSRKKIVLAIAGER